jgi:hypothetical protein
MRFVLILTLVLLQGPSPTSGKGEGQPPQGQPGQQQQRPSPGSSTAPTSPLPAAQTRGETDGNSGKGKSASEWWMIGLTGALLLVAAIQVRLFWRQLDIMDDSLVDSKTAAIAAKDAAEATKESVALTRQTAERQLRAYVFVEKIDPPKRDAPRVFFNVAYKNSGQTPAYDVVVRANTAFGPAQLKSPLVDPAKPRPTASRFILPPGSTHYMQVVPLNLRPEQIAACDAGTHSIYIFGTIRYRDAFKKDRWTNFRYAAPITGGSPESCEAGNEADQNE